MARLYIRSGSTSYGEIIANINTETGDIRAGQTSFGPVIGRYDKRTGRIYAGNGGFGTLSTVGSIDSSGMIRGGACPVGPINAHITHESGHTYLRAGAPSFGTILASITDK